jgi:hypothetical protein
MSHKIGPEYPAKNLATIKTKTNLVIAKHKEVSPVNHVKAHKAFQTKAY